MYYFCDSAGNEIDLILEKQSEVLAVEVKAARKPGTDMFSGIRYCQKYNKRQSGYFSAWR